MVMHFPHLKWWGNPSDGIVKVAELLSTNVTGLIIHYCDVSNCVKATAMFHCASLINDFHVDLSRVYQQRALIICWKPERCAFLPRGSHWKLNALISALESRVQLGIGSGARVGLTTFADWGWRFRVKNTVPEWQICWQRFATEPATDSDYE